MPLSPKKIAVTAAGTIAIRRVMSRRNHGRIRMFRKPSITIWPASVPVSVEFCPEASSARANTALAPATPSSGVSSWYASWISATPVWPARWKVAAATMRIAALMNNAKLSATVESRNAYLTAIRLPAGVSSYALVCTTDECRYKLCGITVAPRIPIAMYSLSGSARIEAVGRKPPATAARSGREMTISNRKQPAMVAISATTSASSSRKPLCCRNSTISTSSAVIAMPHGRGIPNSRFSPIADPITSARSHAAIATSHSTQRASVVGREKWSRHACARSRPVTIPSFAASPCSRIAMRFDRRTTESSVYPKREPPARSVAQLPGSM